MTIAIARDPIYRRRKFQPEIIEQCVRWYLTYQLSYRDLAQMMAEREIVVSHSTILRWVQRYVPEFERRWSRFARQVNSSWRMDETAFSVRGGNHYLYRAVDKHGKTVDSLLCTDRSESAARAFFGKALKTHQPRRPQKVNVDGNAATHRALRLMRKEDPDWSAVQVRSSRYLNNVVEQDHRAVKRRCAPMLALKSFATAAVTLAGIELADRIRKRQFWFGRCAPRRFCSLKQLWSYALDCKNAIINRVSVAAANSDRHCTRTNAHRARDRHGHRASSGKVLSIEQDGSDVHSCVHKVREERPEIKL
jgi:transposase-like protein